MNKHQYPNLSFPEIYVLKGGYREFFQSYRVRLFLHSIIQ
jgi:hypothetical protein